MDAQPGAADRVGRDSTVLSVAAGLVGLLSYVCTVAMAHVLDPSTFGQYAAAQTLLTIVGVVTTALVPLPLAAVVGQYPRGSADRRSALTFALFVSVLLGATAALLTGAVAAVFAPWPVVVAVAVSALALFLAAPAFGFVQGELRFGRYAALSVAEVAVRLLVGIAAVVLGAGVAGAVGACAVGAGLIVVCGFVSYRSDLAWRPRVLTESSRWSETGDVALTQLVVSVLVGVDVVVVAALGGGSPAAAGYAALATLAKGPVYVAAGTVLITFPILRADPRRDSEVLRAALGSFALLALSATAVVATTPTAIVALVLPASYLESVEQLPWLAVAGTGFAGLTVVATVLLAVRARARSRLGLLVATVSVTGGLALGWRWGAETGLAVGSAVGALVAAGFLAVLARPHLPSDGARATARAVTAGAAFAAVLALLHDRPWSWAAVVIVSMVVLVSRTRRAAVPPR